MRLSGFLVRDLVIDTYTSQDLQVIFHEVDFSLLVFWNWLHVCARFSLVSALDPRLRWSR